MSKYQLFRVLSPEQRRILKEDIRARGVQVAVEFDEEGNILDGHHRVELWEELRGEGVDLPPYPVLIRVGWTEAEKRHHVRMLNFARRHMSKAERDEQIVAMRKEGVSYRTIAEVTGVPKSTVVDVIAGVRNRTPDETGELPKNITGADGKSYPAAKPQATVFTSSARAGKDAEKAAAVVIAAQEDPERFGDLLDRMNRTGQVAGAHRKLAAAQQRDHVRDLTLSEVLAGKYPVFYADPPWEYRNSGFYGAAARHYPTLPTEAICALPVPAFAAANAALFLWATNPLLPDALRVMAAWGFEYKTNFVWVKDKALYGKLGFYNYGAHELLLLGIRGAMPPACDPLPVSLIEAPKSEHSRKPAAAYALIERMYPEGPYVELFARSTRSGWTAFGNEVQTWPNN